MKEQINWKQVIIFMGAVIAFAIGAGFATGQEVMQYFASYGYQCILVGIVFLIIMIYTNLSFATAGYNEKFERGSTIFEYYCGPILGKVFDYFTVIFCYLSFVVMVAGASSTLHEQFGLPNLVGGIIIAVLAGGTVILGLNSLVDIIGKIGPVMILFTILIAIITLAMTGSHIPEGVALIENGKVTVQQAGTNWLSSGISYGGFALLWFAGFVSELGAKSKLKELRMGVTFGQIITILTGIVVAFALLANIQDVASAQIPNLVLASKIFPWIGVVFAIIVFAAIFSSATPLLWTAVSRFTEEHTRPYIILTLILTAAGCIIAFFVPFSTLVNVIYVINGYAGFVLVFFMVIKDIRTFLAKKK